MISYAVSIDNNLQSNSHSFIVICFFEVTTMSIVRNAIGGRFNKKGNKTSHVCNVPYFIQISRQVRAGRALLPLTDTRPRLISVILS
jgi:hypothetical protein